MGLEVVLDREGDGRWIAEAPELPGVLAYGSTREVAKAKVLAMALEVLGEPSEEICDECI